MKNGSISLYEVIDMGPIVAKDEELGLLVTVNGAYLNLWVARHLAQLACPRWDNTDCRSGHPDLYTLTVAKAMELAEEWLEELRKGDDNEEDAE